MGLRNRYLFKGEKCFFVTTTCVHWINLIDYSNCYTLLEDSLMFVCNKYEADILSYVIMPNHLHLVVYFRGQNRLSDFMRDFKKFTSTMIRKNLDKPQFSKLMKKLRIDQKGRAFQVWQHRFDDLYLKGKRYAEIKINYIHNNPLQERWNLTDRPEKYKFSSAQYYELYRQPGCSVTDYREYF